jgi:aspartate/tyrosine/aromatic aminotransferase
MFDRLPLPQPDGILAVMNAFRADPRGDKVDLGVGVYKDASGRTPVMRAVKAAEARLVAEQDTKTYTQLVGDPAFHAAMTDLILGQAVPPARLAAAASTGGTGAVRLGFELIRAADPEARLWISRPTWPNHITIAEALGIGWHPYRWLDPEAGALDRAGLMADLAQAKAGDVVVLHGCCHNPTGVDMDPADWAAMADLCAARGLIPMVDIAYQGFGTGLEADAAGLHLLVARLPRVIVAASGAKNFGLYRERVGIALVITPESERDVVQATLAALNRAAISFPPDHGARVVTTILTDPALRADWQAELEAMRARIEGLRRMLAEALREETGSDRMGFVAAQRGMFSTLPLNADRVARLARDHGVYAVGGGRVNMAGVTEANVLTVARALAAVLKE